MTPSIVHVVDDDEGTRKATARLLTAEGFETRTYGSALDFLSADDLDRPGCVILDIRLPDEHGLAVQATLRDRGNPLPIVFMTGDGEIAQSLRAIEGGAVAFLTKPVDGDALLAAVSRALAQDAAFRASRRV